MEAPGRIPRRRLPDPGRSAGLAIVAAPFLFYFYVLNRHLRPVEFPDAFAYLWRAPFSLHYLTGRSLTQRVMYTLLGNDALVIANAQLALYLLAAACVFVALRRRHVLLDLVVAVAVAGLFSSYALNVIATDVMPEPVHIALLLVFHVALFTPLGAAHPSLLLAAGVPFVFSRNTAPYFVLVQLGLFLLLGGWRAPRRALRPVAVLAVLAFAAIGLMWRFDSSLHLNVVNSVYQHVFPDPAVTEHFRVRAGMPVGPFVERCRGQDVMSPCLDGRPVFRVRDESRSYELTDDSHGFLDWVRRRGRQAWTRYLLWDGIPWTLGRFEEGFRTLYSGEPFRFFGAFYLSYRPRPSDPDNHAVLVRLRPGGSGGFLGVEPLEVTRGIGARLGLTRLHLVALYLLLGVVLTLAVPDGRFLRAGVTAMAGGLVLVFLGYFGDPMELHRHVIPGLLLFALGTASYAAGLAEAALALARSSWLRRWRVRRLPPSLAEAPERSPDGVAQPRRERSRATPP